MIYFSEAEVLKIMQQCPRFKRCSVPVCPLDLKQDDRVRLPAEPKCTLPKSKREKIGKGTALPRQGLTKREWAAQEYWRTLDESEKANRTAQLRPFRSISTRDSEQPRVGRGKDRGVRK